MLLLPMNDVMVPRRRPGRDTDEERGPAAPFPMPHRRRGGCVPGHCADDDRAEGSREHVREHPQRHQRRSEPACDLQGLVARCSHRWVAGSQCRPLRDLVHEIRRNPATVAPDGDPTLRSAAALPSTGQVDGCATSRRSLLVVLQPSTRVSLSAATGGAERALMARLTGHARGASSADELASWSRLAAASTPEAPSQR